MCNIYVNYNRKPNKYFLFRWIRRTGNTCFVVIASLHCYMARAFSSWCRNEIRCVMDGRAAFDAAITGRSAMSQPRRVFVVGRRNWNRAAGE